MIEPELLPPERGESGTLPASPSLSPATYRSRFHGALLGGAIGDALGRPAEGRRPEKVRERHGTLTDFKPWRGWKAGPKGAITGDTQMSMCVAETLAAHGRLDPEDLARRFVDWLPVGRGKGRTSIDDGRPATSRRAPRSLTPSSRSARAGSPRRPSRSRSTAPLVAIDFETGVLFAVNHGGDSDSIGAITGNLLGTLHGVGPIPAPWLEEP